MSVSQSELLWNLHLCNVNKPLDSLPPTVTMQRVLLDSTLT
jgi:hypothetical protein